MYKIKLTENKPGGHECDLFVNEHTYANLEDVEFAGGFRRFNIDIFDSCEGEFDRRRLEKFLHAIGLGVIADSIVFE